MSNLPWMKFYPAAWRGDQALRMCSLAARGLWMEMLTLMHEASPRGLLLINGKAITTAQLSVLVGTDASNVQAMLDELENAGVFSRKKNGVIFSRRMERDENRARKNRENGKLGGNPTLSKQTEIEVSDNPSDKAKSIEVRGESREDKKEDPSGRDASKDVRKTLFDDGVKVLCRRAGLPDRKARALIAKWLKDADDDAGKVLAKIRQAEADDVAEMIAWVTKAVHPQKRSWRDEPEYRGVDVNPLSPAEVERYRAMGLS